MLIEVDLQTGAKWGCTLGKVARSLARSALLVSPAAGFAYAAATTCALVTIGLFLAQTRGGMRRDGTVARLVGLQLLQPAITVVLAYKCSPCRHFGRMPPSRWRRCRPAPGRSCWPSYMVGRRR